VVKTNRLIEKMQKIAVRLEEKGVRAGLLAQYKSLLGKARDLADKASAAFSKVSTEGESWRASFRAGMNYIRQAFYELRQARRILGQMVSDLRGRAGNSQHLQQKTENENE